MLFLDRRTPFRCPFRLVIRAEVEKVKISALIPIACEGQSPPVRRNRRENSLSVFAGGDVSLRFSSVSMESRNKPGPGVVESAEVKTSHFESGVQASRSGHNTYQRRIGFPQHPFQASGSRN